MKHLAGPGGQQAKHSSGVEKEVDADIRRINGWNKWMRRKSGWD